MTSKTAIRGQFLDIKSLVQQPEQIAEQIRYVEDGLLLVEQGKIVWFGTWQDGQAQLDDTFHVEHYPEQLIIPGFLDTHIHYPQTEMVGAYGEQLLEWLDTYTFPTEIQYQDAEHAQQIAEIFIQELLKNGTTTALVFCTVHPQSVDALFAAAEKYHMRLIAGK
ncbi:hypothetical protein GWI33_010846, partial [Rhynchophorus ferrugineus]